VAETMLEYRKRMEDVVKLNQGGSCQGFAKDLAKELNKQYNDKHLTYQSLDKFLAETGELSKVSRLQKKNLRVVNSTINRRDRGNSTIANWMNNSANVKQQLIKNVTLKNLPLPNQSMDPSESRRSSVLNFAQMAGRAQKQLQKYKATIPSSNNDDIPSLQRAVSFSKFIEPESNKKVVKVEEEPPRMKPIHQKNVSHGKLAVPKMPSRFPRLKTSQSSAVIQSQVPVYHLPTFGDDSMKKKSQM